MASESDVKSQSTERALIDKQPVLGLLGTHRDRLDEFAVESLFLFGSVARDEATPDSHEYFQVDAEIVWQTTRIDLPVLRDALQRILQNLAPDHG